MTTDTTIDPQAVDCPSCEAPAGTACTFRGHIHGPSHAERRQRAAAHARGPEKDDVVMLVMNRQLTKYRVVSRVRALLQLRLSWSRQVDLSIDLRERPLEFMPRVGAWYEKR